MIQNCTKQRPRRITSSFELTPSAQADAGPPTLIDIGRRSTLAPARPRKISKLDLAFNSVLGTKLQDETPIHTERPIKLTATLGTVDFYHYIDSALAAQNKSKIK